MSTDSDVRIVVHVVVTELVASESAEVKDDFRIVVAGTYEVTTLQGDPHGNVQLTIKGHWMGQS